MDVTEIVEVTVGRGKSWFVSARRSQTAAIASASRARLRARHAQAELSLGCAEASAADADPPRQNPANPRAEEHQQPGCRRCPGQYRTCRAPDQGNGNGNFEGRDAPGQDGGQINRDVT
jgi:hypothetical protein